MIHCFHFKASGLMQRHPSGSAVREEDPIQWELLPDVVSQLFSPAAAGTSTGAASTSVETLFSDLDRLIGGFRNSSLVVLGSRPAMGKTALALNIAENVALKQRRALGIFSLDMTAAAVAQRLVCSTAQVKLECLAKGTLAPAESQRMAVSIQAMREATLLIDDSSGTGIFELVKRAQKMKERFNIALLIIDYVQLVTMYGPYISTTSKYQDAAEVVRMLKSLAKELQIPILCLSQLSRKVEERALQRPQLTDLQGSSALEDLADVVLFLSRRDDYNSSNAISMAELMVAKNRHGALGTVPLLFHKEFFRFSNPSEQNKT